MVKNGDEPRRADDVAPVPESKPDAGQPEPGDNQDVAAERIYPTDPTGADPT